MKYIVDNPTHVIFTKLEDGQPVMVVRSDKCNFGGLKVLFENTKNKHGTVDITVIDPPDNLDRIHTIVRYPKTLTADGYHELLGSLLSCGVPICYSGAPNDYKGAFHVYDNDSTSNLVEKIANAWGCTIEAGGNVL